MYQVPVSFHPTELRVTFRAKNKDDFLSSSYLLVTYAS